MSRPKQKCTIDGCDNWRVGRGLCRKHYTRWDRWGDPLALHPLVRGVCTIDGCDQPQKAHGWCETHYRRWQRWGDPLHTQWRRIIGTPEERFWPRVDKNGPVPEHRPDLGPCWVWTGRKNHDGYGLAPSGLSSLFAHSWAYTHVVGPVPDGLELDHLCRVRACVRPDHLEPVTHAENSRRGQFANSRKTHCPQGHPYDAQNTYVSASGSRSCRACGREWQARYEARQRLAASG